MTPACNLENKQSKTSQTINRQASPLLSRIFSAILHAVNEGLKHIMYYDLKLNSNNKSWDWYTKIIPSFNLNKAGQ